MNFITILEENVNSGFFYRFNDPVFIVEFILSIIFVLGATLYIAFRINRTIVWLYFGILDVLYVISLCFFNYDILMIAILAFIIGGGIIFILSNTSNIQKYISSRPLFTKKSKDGKRVGVNNAKQAVIHAVCEAVRYLRLSPEKKHIGALITFEQSNPLDQYIASGTIINCPVSAEIIETIFYEGTRLHDGAIIIRGGTIVAASVMYPPYNGAVAGKLGARHRAAVGISKNTDSVTIVISEETGIVSIAHNGAIDHTVRVDDLEETLNNFIK
jgi:uncharacterized protein (TIGR00159 family)